MWIRSQDKEFLMKVDNINLELNRLFTFVDGVTTAFTLGTYKSKERAIEVLDEIQYKIQCLNDDFYYEHVEFVKNKSYTGYKKQHKDIVYQMPEV